jgi:hypothetical protein
MPAENGKLLGRDIVFIIGSDGSSIIGTTMRPIPPGSNIAGQVTGTLVNTYVKGPNVSSPDGFYIGSHPANSSYIAFGLSGTPGMTIDAGDSRYIPIENLSEIYLSVAVSGDKIVWSMV